MPSEQCACIIERIDQLNSEDPHQELAGGAPVPYELLYSQRVSEWVRRLMPEASEALLIAARGQHIQRWTIPREQYARNRQGYLRWRETLKAFHGKTVGKLMWEAGYSDEAIQRVRMIMSKRQLPSDPDTQTLEDALCLVFLETQFADLRKKTPDEKMAEVLRKTWKKMSAQAREAALRLPLGESERQLLAETLGEDRGSVHSP